jgi:phage gp45-like
LISTFKSEYGLDDRSTARPRIGLVTSTDPERARVKVLIQPEGTLSGWIPVVTSWSGNGWGMLCLPLQGDQVLIIPQEGRIDHYIVVGSLYSNLARPPEINPGELILCHRTGSSLHLLNTGDIMITGNLLVTGDISDFHGSLSHLRQTYNEHRHILNSGTTTAPTVSD